MKKPRSNQAMRVGRATLVLRGLYSISLVLAVALGVPACADDDGGETPGGAAACQSVESCEIRCNDNLSGGCFDASAQATCRSLCASSADSACQAFISCNDRATLSDCAARDDCWAVFQSGPMMSTSSGNSGDACSNACGNVVALCGVDGGIDFNTCISQCGGFPPSAIDCAIAANNCSAVGDCIGGFPE